QRLSAVASEMPSASATSGIVRPAKKRSLTSSALAGSSLANSSRASSRAMLTGHCATNKGMALFPRKIRGRFGMVARLDNENLHYMESDQVCVWNEARLLLAPKYPWEVIQIGNCGSPIETEAGWLLLTHGVGPMRQYCIGAILLDLDNPCRVIGH